MRKQVCVTKIHNHYLTFDEGSAALGQATASLQQTLLMDAQIASAVRSVKDQIIEKVIKKMLKLNFNIDPKIGYGDFTLNPNTDPQTASLKVQNLLYAMSIGVISQNDQGANNLLRDLLGVPKVNEKEYLETLIKSTELQILQQQIMRKAEA